MNGITTLCFTENRARYSFVFIRYILLCHQNLSEEWEKSQESLISQNILFYYHLVRILTEWKKSIEHFKFVKKQLVNPIFMKLGIYK